jgi:chorismate mutase/prephenate dehydratase
MDGKAQLEKLRKQMDEIDAQLVPLFLARMDVSAQMADVKGKSNIAIPDDVRELHVVEHAVSLGPSALKAEISLLMRSLIALSKEHQRKLLFSENAPLLPPPKTPLKDGIVCVYQGVPGSWNEQALMKLYPHAQRQAAEFYEDVFLAVKNKSAHYGIVPIENSKTGAIGETYDLLRKYGCYIVGHTWIDIRHCLIAPSGTKISDIREVFSTSEGFRQCKKYLRNHVWNLTTCHNTAIAAETVTQSGDGKTAAISTRLAAEINGLHVLAPDITDAADNRTSFVAIALEPEYGEQDDLISITFSTQHRSGALCETLLPFMGGGLNLSRIESRPGSPDKYRFFAEVQGNILDENTVSVLRHVAAACEYFEVIGCYSNIGKATV